MTDANISDNLDLFGDLVGYEPSGAGNDAAISHEPENAAEAVSVAAFDTIEADDEKKATKAERFVRFAQERVELFHDKNRETFATVKQTGHTYRIESSLFSDWLTASLMIEADMVAGEQPKREAIATLRSIARHKGDELPVWNRCGIAEDGAYVVDLCQPDNSAAVVIRPGSWEWVMRPPVKFVRPADAMPLPTPIKGGDISPLWSVSNIPESFRPLVLAWLLEAIRPDTPYPVLELVGEEGTAKSTTQAALRNLIDPNRCNLRSAPRNREDVSVSASVNHVVSYENMSHLSADIQDVLCSVSTGGGYSTRKLFTNGEEHTLDFKNPIVLNGISAVITQQDLLSRAISIELPRIMRRQEEGQTRAIFATHYASMLGGLFDLLAASLAQLPNVSIDPCELPRMADFCKLGMAMYMATGKDQESFRLAYADTQRDSIQRTIDSSPVASAILALLEHEPFGVTEPVGKILDRLSGYKPERCEAWPKSGRGLGDALRRLSPAFSKIGVEIRSRNDLSKRDGIQWSIEKPQSPAKSSSPRSQTSQNTEEREQCERGELSLTANRGESSSAGSGNDDCEVF